MISMTYEYLAMFAVHMHSHFTITHQRTYNTTIFPCGSTVRCPVPMRNSLPYYNQLSAMSSLYMFLDTSSSSNGTMDGWSFYIVTFQSVLYLSVFTYMNLSLVRERTEWQQIKISLIGINNGNLLTTCCRQYILLSYFVHYPVFQKHSTFEK
jgi:hypothetical protein